MQRRARAESRGAHYRRALAIKHRLLGDDQLDVAVTLNNHAALLIEQQRYGEAEPILRRALAIFERALDPTHPSLDLCRANHAHTGAMTTRTDGRTARSHPGPAAALDGPSGRAARAGAQCA